MIGYLQKCAAQILMKVGSLRFFYNEPCDLFISILKIHYECMVCVCIKTEMSLSVLGLTQMERDNAHGMYVNTDML